MSDRLEELNVDPKKEKKYKIIRIVINAILILACIGIILFVTIKYGPYFFELSKNEVKRNEFIEKIKGYGHYSFWIVLALQIGQVIFMIIPSGPIVIASGVLFNPFVAVIVCLIGQTIGGMIVYLLVKLIGYRFVALFTNPNKIKESKLFGNKSKTGVMMFGYLMIPALPKDVVAFIAPFTKINVLEFSLINFVARIPMTIVSVVFGLSLVTGNYVISICLGAFSAVCALLCFIFNKQIVHVLDNMNKKIKKDDNKDDKEKNEK